MSSLSPGDVVAHALNVLTNLSGQLSAGLAPDAEVNAYVRQVAHWVQRHGVLNEVCAALLRGGVPQATIEAFWHAGLVDAHSPYSVRPLDFAPTGWTLWHGAEAYQPDSFAPAAAPALPLWSSSPDLLVRPESSPLPRCRAPCTPLPRCAADTRCAVRVARLALATRLPALH